MEFDTTLRTMSNFKRFAKKTRNCVDKISWEREEMTAVRTKDKVLNRVDIAAATHAP